MMVRMPCSGITELVGSGNAVRKNPALRLALKRVFGMTPQLPDTCEEAACGAAMYSAAASGAVGSISELSEKIHMIPS